MPSTLSHSKLCPSTILILLATLISLSLSTRPSPAYSPLPSLPDDSPPAPGGGSTTNLSSLSPFADLSQQQQPFPAATDDAVLTAESNIQCFHTPSPAFSKKVAEIRLAVTQPSPGLPAFQPFAAYGRKPYWFLINGEHTWEVRVTPEIGLSWNNLALWWDLELRRSAVRIVDWCVGQAGMGGRQRWLWRGSDDFTNPDTAVEVQVWRGRTDIPVKHRQSFCAIC